MSQSLQGLEESLLANEEELGYDPWRSCSDMVINEWCDLSVSMNFLIPPKYIV